MKKTVLAVIIIIALGYYAKVHFFAEKRVLRIGVECDYPPNNWQEASPSDTNLPLANEPGAYVEGYDIQVARSVAEELGVELAVYKIAWDNLIPSLNNREIDAIFSAMLDTSPRKQLISFSDSYDPVMTEYCIAVLRTNHYAHSHSIGEFSGARLVAQKGAHLDTVIDQIEGVIHLPGVSTFSDAVEMVLNGQADGTVVNYDTGMIYQRKYKDLVVIRFPVERGFHLDFSGACAGVRKNDKKLLDDINKAVNKISRRNRQSMMDRTLVRELRSVY